MPDTPRPTPASPPAPPPSGAAGPLRLHIGSGDKRLEGWVNIDLQALPGVDVVADVTRGLNFRDVQAVFAEHFLEHLAIDHAIGFLLEVHRVLRADGWLRLSTPNLDWVWETHYRRAAEPADKRLMALVSNRAFRGWGHQFLWNPEMLDEALAACGFVEIRACRYGESERPEFRGLERHETYQDQPDLPHVIIREARKGLQQPERLAALRRQIRENFGMHLAG